MMTRRRLGTGYAVLAVLDRPHPWLFRLRPRLAEQGRFSGRRTPERRLTVRRQRLPRQSGYFGGSCWPCCGRNHLWRGFDSRVLGDGPLRT
jgi:hypothetical protein